MPDTQNFTALARRVAARACVSDIELHAQAVQMDGQRWYDTRPMVDEREHCPEAVDMGREAITLALGLHLVETHPQHDYLLRVRAHALTYSFAEAGHAQH